MLWFDNDPKSEFLSKVRRAAAYYRDKYGEEPNLCFVHPSMLDSLQLNAGTINICSNGSILPHHFWIGVQQNQSANPDPVG